MNGTRALRIIAFMSISIGIGILSRAAWGFVAFGILVLIDNFVIPYRPPAPPDRVVVEREIIGAIARSGSTANAPWASFVGPPGWLSANSRTRARATSLGPDRQDVALGVGKVEAAAAGKWECLAHNAAAGGADFPMQNVEKMRFRMSSAVVAPVMASMGPRARSRDPAAASRAECRLPRRRAPFRGTRRIRAAIARGAGW
jgi:hypothetical protein